MVDPATLPEMVSPKAARESKEERKIELSEIIGLPDFDVSHSLPALRPYLVIHQ